MLLHRVPTMGVESTHYRHTDLFPTLRAGWQLGVGRKEEMCNKDPLHIHERTSAPQPLPLYLIWLSFVVSLTQRTNNDPKLEMTNSQMLLTCSLGHSHLESFNISLALLWVFCWARIPCWTIFGSLLRIAIPVISCIVRRSFYFIFICIIFFWSSRATIWSQWQTQSKGYRTTRSRPEVTHYLKSHGVSYTRKVYSLLLEQISYNEFYFMCFPGETWTSVALHLTLN